MNDRKSSVKQRIDQKGAFRSDLKDIVDEPGLQADLASFDVVSGKVNRVKMSEGLNLSRKQSDLIYKEDFESKISKMSDRIQSEIEDTEKMLTLNPDLFSP